MNTPGPLPAPERDALVSRLAEMAPEHARLLDGGHAVDADRLGDLTAYPGVTFYLVRVLLPQRPVELLVGHTLDGLVLVGDDAGLAELNRRTGLVLGSAAEVAAYLRSWFLVSGRLESRIVEDRADFPFFGFLDEEPEMQEIAGSAAELACPLVVTEEPGASGYTIEATVLVQQTLQRWRCQVSPTGLVDVLEQTDLLTDVPVPFLLR